MPHQIADSIMIPACVTSNDGGDYAITLTFTFIINNKQYKKLIQFSM